MAAYLNVMGFYVAVGSKDYPSIWPATSPFGFENLGSTSVSIFESSMYDLMNAFKEPISFLKAYSISSIPTANFISQLVFEKPDPEFNPAEVYADTNDNRWITVAMILDYLFLHQDERDVIVNTFETTIGTILPVTRVSHYIPDSLSIGIQDAVDVSRINYVRFKLNHGTPGDDVEYMFYFNPDKLISFETASRKAVFLYEDLDDDQFIGKTEWEKQIIEKHLALFENARYSEYKTFPTTYKSLSGDLMVHYFFVYSIVTLQLENVKNTIREFLLTSRRGADGSLPPYTYSECVYHYPNLFSDRSAGIFPIEVINPQDGVSFMSPASFKDISHILNLNNYEPSNLNYKNSEVIFIGSEDASLSYTLPFALIVVSNDENDSLPPVSSKMAKFTPIYNEIVYTDPLTEPYMKFHKLIRISLSVMYNIISINHSSVVDINTFDPEVNLIETLVDGVRQVSFMFSGVTYILHR